MLNFIFQFTQFRRLEDIPADFIYKHVRLRGRVREVVTVPPWESKLGKSSVSPLKSTAKNDISNDKSNGIVQQSNGEHPKSRSNHPLSSSKSTSSTTDGVTAVPIVPFPDEAISLGESILENLSTPKTIATEDINSKPTIKAINSYNADDSSNEPKSQQSLVKEGISGDEFIGKDLKENSKFIKNKESSGSETRSSEETSPTESELSSARYVTATKTSLITQTKSNLGQTRELDEELTPLYLLVGL